MKVQFVRQWVSACLGAIDAMAFPWACRICGLDLQAGPFCEGCRAELLGAAAPTCSRCAMPLGPWMTPDRGCPECRGRALGFDRAIALGPYQGPIRDLCLQLKHERNAWLAPWLVDVLVEARSGAFREHGDSYIVPIPQHWRRRLARGYNQAEALATRLGRRLALKVIHPLRRVIATPTLARMGRIERTRLMRDAFHARSVRALRGRTILLVDDILTTGATCGAAARTLKRAGAGRVVVVVIGRAEGRA